MEVINISKRRWYTLFVILLPMLNQYTILSMNFMDIFNIFALLSYLLTTKGKIKTGNGYIPYILYALVLMFISMLGLSVYSPVLMLKSVVSFTIFVFNLFFVGPDFFDLEYGFKCYVDVTLLSCIVVIFQTILNVGFGKRLILVFPWSVLNYGNGMSGATFISTVASYQSYRASAFFLEPSYFASFCLPILFIALFNSDARLSTKNIVRCLFVTVSVCLTTSMLGIVGCVIAWSIYLAQMLWTSKRRKLIILIPIVIGVGLYIYNLDSVQAQILSKMYSAQNLTMSTSLSVRLTRGWYCFAQLSPVHKMIGVGYGCVGPFFTQHNITTIIDGEGIVNSYMNGISLMLCSMGIIGSLLYLFPLFKMFIQNKKICMLLVCWGILMFTSQVFDSANYFVLMIFIILISGERREDGMIVDYSVNKI